ncbi:facilitated trehalose transporter Tret1-like isoform X2 [Ochlerotatus camptorhynchus]|uniref:facilitated trehalose transporter Tret1-like isoform X2 n=1 Tax=Ochlerotatus camptorhynchus TaxID=644619 RepID=UPI0031D3EA21
MGSVGKVEQSSRRMLSNQSSNDSMEMQKRCRLAEKWTAVLFTVVASLGYLSVGTMVAWSCNAFTKVYINLDDLTQQRLTLTRGDELSQNQRTSLAATPALAAAIAAVVVYKLYYKVGTKLFMLMAASLMIASNCLLSFGTSFWFFSAGRALAGISAGICYTLIPPYVDEFGSKQFKPLLDSVLYVQFALGILIQLMSDLIPITEFSSVISSAFPIFLFIGFLFLPESARYLCATQQVNHARAVLKKTHTNDALSIQVMENNLNHWQQCKYMAVPLLESLRKLQNSRIVYPTILLIVFQQFTGAIPAMFYLTRIFTLSHGEYSPEWTAIYVAGIFTISIPVYRLLNFKIGDYKLLLWSSFLMATAMAGLGWHCHVQGMRGHSDEYGHIPLLCSGIFIFLYAIGFQRLPWKWLDESLEEENVFPLRTIATAISWASLYVCVRLVPTLVTFIGVGWLFWNMSIVLLFGALFIMVVIPNLDRSAIQSKTLAECSSSSSSSNLEAMEHVV